MKTVMIGEKKFHLPFLEEIPFDPHQLKDLGSSIEEAGSILIPVLCWKEKKTATSETVVDGAHRVLEAHRLNIKVPVCYRSFENEAEAREECERINFERRHLAPQQLVARREKRIARIAARRAAGESQRTIAEEEGISRAQVKRDLAAAENVGQGESELSTGPGGPVDNSDKPGGRISGADGRTQTATPDAPLLCSRCTRVGPVKDCQACAEARKAKRKKKRRGEYKPSRNGQLLKDDYGNEIPKRCKDAWGDKWIPQTLDFLEDVSEKFRKQRIAEGMHKRSKHYPFFVSKDVVDGCGFIISYLDDLIKHLKTFRPDGVCPSCSGSGCPDCRQAGLVPKEKYAELKK